eukprot:COSAG01_NODE_14457_length_1451_cov_2.463757_2_plen_87_part_00
MHSSQYAFDTTSVTAAGDAVNAQIASYTAAKEAAEVDAAQDGSAVDSEANSSVEANYEQAHPIPVDPGCTQTCACLYALLPLFPRC